ncbi:general secretion pathway protein GspL [Variovorax sp. ZS18.2.2]|uniref:general secretion pathway protein GspL n=1 Tax=Variovorax sp. ZS18.2.2 TaxID=2971255 RepID=UPI0021516226|nr:general secretion pathway protein GspL [Variovorax sp. ZS18.2.2]MCR6477809.1 general secretion pathway protein GspL [Variovorax sp. ZS18.2.2]
MVGVLVGLLIAMMLLMKWLVEHQVSAAAERRVRETAVRAAAALCLELKSHAATHACLKDLQAKSGSDAGGRVDEGDGRDAR